MLNAKCKMNEQSPARPYREQDLCIPKVQRIFAFLERRWQFKSRDSKAIYKPIYWVYRVAGGLWHWARRRFTLAGLCVAGAFLVAGAVSTDVENTVTYQSFSLLLAFLLPALAGSLFFRAKFAATRALPRFGTAGQLLFYRVRIKNLTAKTQAGLTLLEDLAELAPGFSSNGWRFNWPKAGASARSAWRNDAGKIRSAWRM